MFITASSLAPGPLIQQSGDVNRNEGKINEEQKNERQRSKE